MAVGHCAGILFWGQLHGFPTGPAGEPLYSKSTKEEETLFRADGDASDYRRPAMTIINVPGLAGRVPGLASSNSAVGR